MASGIPFGRYRLQKRLARGGMAEVFLAQLHGAEGFERRVAIKRILPHLSDSDEFRGMFMDEARLAAMLSHPNVVHVYDFGREGEHYFIAMEFVDGVPLSRLIQEAKRAKVGWEFAARIAADVCAGLHYAHHLSDDDGRPQNLVHRDVSPQNILVTWDGVVKLVDFGIAKAAWSAGRTRPGMVKGKWTYMSPEQCEGRKLDGRSDIFALGVVTYELLTGEPGYRRDDAELAMREIRSGKRLEPERFRPDVPSELGDIIRRATAADKRDRYATAGEMQLELERFMSDSGRVTTSHLVAAWLREGYPREEPLESGEGFATAAEEEGTPAEVAQPSASRQRSGAINVGDAGDVGDGPTRVRTGKSREVAAAVVAPALSPGRAAAERAVAVGVRPARSLLKPQSAQSHTDLVKPLERSRLPWIAVGGALMLLLGSGSFAVYRLRHRAVETPPPTAALVDPASAVPPIAAPRLPPGAQKPPPDQTAPPLEFTALDIATRPPGARIAIDGKTNPRATPLYGEALAPGPHHLAIVHLGFQRRELDVSLAAGERRSLDIELRPLKPIRSGKPSGGITVAPAAPGFLTVKTIPWSKVYEGARLLGTTPFAGVSLAAGAHALTFVNPDRPSLTRRVLIKPGAEQRLSLELPQ